MKKGIIFDLDGTLWDSSHQIIDVWNEELKKYPELNKQITLEDIQGFMGKRIEEIAAIMFPQLSEEARQKILFECCDAECRHLSKHGGTLYPELENVLSTLSHQYHLSIVSNCQDGYIQSFLHAHKMSSYFSDMEMSGRTGLPKGNNIKLIISRNHLDKAVYIGDTMGDFYATREAGIPFIYASYGFGEVPDPDYTLKSFPDLPALISQIL